MLTGVEGAVENTLDTPSPALLLPAPRPLSDTAEGRAPVIVLDAVRLCLLTTHLLGMASIVGPFLAQMRHRTGFATGIMLGGAIVQMVTGVALFGVRHATDLDVNYAKITVKLGIALAVLFAAILAARAQKREDNVKPLFHTAGGLAVVNVLVATLWP